MSTLIKQISKITDLADLQAVIDEATTQHDTLLEATRVETLAKVEALAQSLGMTTAQLLRGKVSSEPSVKFRHREDASLTWSGRGRKPGWFAAADVAGLVEHVG